MHKVQMKNVRHNKHVYAQTSPAVKVRGRCDDEHDSLHTKRDKYYQPTKICSVIQ